MNPRVSFRLLVLGLVSVGPAFSQWRDARSQEENPPSRVAASPQELFKRLSPSVFVVEALNESGSVVAIGSGVAVESDQIVTNKHVIEGGVTLRVKQGSKTWPATLTHLDLDHDLCRLKVNGLKAAPVPLRLSSALAVGERVYAIGAPEGLELTLSEGLISGLREFEQVRLIQTSAAISPGSSGGGLFDAQGRLVGITTFFLQEGQNLNFALPGEWVQALAEHQLTANRKAGPSSPTFSALAWFQVGLQAYEAGEYEEALKAFHESVRLKPDDASVWYNLGHTYDDLDQYGQAIKAYQEAIRLKPDDVVDWYNLGVAYSLQGNRSKVMQVYETLKTLDRNQADEFFQKIVLP